MSCSSVFVVLRRYGFLPLTSAKIVFRNQKTISRRREPRKNAVGQRKNENPINTPPHLICALPLSRKTTVFDYNFLPLKNQPKTAKNL